jgi:hypothetical protein
VTTRACTECRAVYPLDLFHKSKHNAAGRSLICKDCKRARRVARYAANPEKYAARRRVAYEKNREKELAYNAAWMGANRHTLKPPSAAALKAARVRWRARHLDAARAAGRERESLRRSRAPAWVSPKEFGAIYRMAATLQEASGRPVQVDHVVPLAGKTVCGLHVPWNLRIIPASVNNRKRAKLPRDIDAAFRRSDRFVMRVLELNKRKALAA